MYKTRGNDFQFTKQMYVNVFTYYQKVINSIHNIRNVFYEWSKQNENKTKAAQIAVHVCVPLENCVLWKYIITFLVKFLAIWVYWWVAIAYFCWISVIWVY